MSKTITSNSLAVAAPEKPVDGNESVKFPPFAEPKDEDFEEDILEEEKNHYKNKFPDLNAIKHEKLHCSACDRHLGCSARNESRMRMHPMLRTLMCQTCHTFYNSGEFDKGEDGSELYCRWCGQGGQVYCCSDCPVVFCAKCIKRNFGMPKIREIENTDDWKCFKCNPRCLWDLRALCWALLRYCDLRNKITHLTQEPALKEAYQKACSIDESECCKAKKDRRKEKEAKRKDLVAIKPERTAANKAFNAITTVNTMTKIPPSIQVKKFASINLDESPPKEKKAQKRPAPVDKDVLLKGGMLKTPITVSNKLINPIANLPPAPKKIRNKTTRAPTKQPEGPSIVMPNMPNMPMQVQTVRMPQRTYQPSNFQRIRPRPPPPVNALTPMAVLSNYLSQPNMHMMNNSWNDNINLSLESLTQGLDMSAVAGLSNQDVVCTPDFPLEPLCEVTEDTLDDDVECMTPGPPAAPKMPSPPPLVARSLADVRPDNIVQMTDNDVTVNAATGGLKFRVDPQTLSSNKMYRLPDGRVFAINANPNMPGGYSATIVALSDNSSPKPAAKGSTYAAKLSAITQTPSPTPARQSRTPNRANILRRSTPKNANRSRSNVSESSSNRACDLKIPVEWYRYNLIDAVDALEYSISRLHKLKKEATTMYLRTRNVEEMRYLHKTLDNLLKTSSTRFNEIRENLNKEMKRYVKKKTTEVDNISDDEEEDDDDVEILNDVPDDPIFIDENSMDSNNANMTTEVDLTGPASSEHNDSIEKATDKDPLLNSDMSNENFLDKKDKEAVDNQKKTDKQLNKDQQNKKKEQNSMERSEGNDQNVQNELEKKDKETNEINGDIVQSDEKQEDNKFYETNKAMGISDMAEKPAIKESQQFDSEGKGKDVDIKKDKPNEEKDFNINNGKTQDKSSEGKDVDINSDKIRDETNDEVTDNQNLQEGDMNEDKIHDTEMTEELIDSLLKDDNESLNMNCMDIPEDFPEP